MSEKEPDENDHPEWTRSGLDAETARMEALKEEMTGKLASLQEKIRTLQSMNPDRPWLALDESQAENSHHRGRAVPQRRERCARQHLLHQRGPHGEALLRDMNGIEHVFQFETFCNSYEALTLVNTVG